MKKLVSKDLLGIRNLSVEEINLIFETADRFKEVLQRPNCSFKRKPFT